MKPTRRAMLEQSGQGFGALALAALLADDARADFPPIPHHKPRATRVIHLFMAGGASQVDLFDHNPRISGKRSRPFKTAWAHG